MEQYTQARLWTASGFLWARIILGLDPELGLGRNLTIHPQPMFCPILELQAIRHHSIFACGFTDANLDYTTVMAFTQSDLPG